MTAPHDPSRHPEDLPADALRVRWEVTLGSSVDWEHAAVDVSYRPPLAPTADLRRAPATRPIDIISPSPPPTPATGTEPRTPLDLDPTLVPGFEILEEIGRGGMGVVYRARQTSLDREVALKMILAPDSGRRAAARFFTEATITGFLEHPNIVPVYDVGETEDGRCFLAMKLVDGHSWRELLRERGSAPAAATGIEVSPTRISPDLERELRILLDVCDAVAFAHSRGVLHRDLKPSNIMVGEFGEVLLMDWGIALPSVGRRTLDDLATFEHELDAPAGTPVYIPPELALGHVHAMGPWSDTYLLGGILHEILTGSPPHEGGTLSEVLARAIASASPSFPLTVPTELAHICRRALAADPRNRFPSARQFRTAIEDYLRHRESIAAAATATASLARADAHAASSTAAESPADESARRYESFAEGVAGFAQALTLWPGNDDARRSLWDARRRYADEAMRHGDLGLAAAQVAEMAEPDEPTLELRRRLADAQARRARRERNARRTRVALVAATLALIIGLGTGLVLLAREQARTQDALHRAESRFNDVRALAHALINDIHDEVERLPGATRARQLIVTQAVEYLDRLSREPEADARLMSEMATAYERVAGVQGLYLVGNLGDTVGAFHSIERAVQIRERLAAAAPNSVPAQLDLAEARGLLADAHLKLGHLDEADRAVAAATAIGEQAYRRAPDRAEAAFRQGRNFERRADLERARGAMSRAVDAQRRAIALFDESIAAGMRSVDVVGQRIEARATLAELLRRAGEATLAKQEADRAVELARTAWQQHRDDAPALRVLASTLEHAGRPLRDVGDVAGAIAAQREAVAIRERIVALDPLNRQAAADQGGAWCELGDALDADGRFAEAEPLFQKWLTNTEALLRQDPANGDLSRDLRLAHERLGACAVELRHFDDAVTHQRAAVALAEQALTRDPTDRRARFDAANMRTHLGSTLLDLGQLEDAAVALTESLTQWRSVIAADPTHAEARLALSVTLEHLGDVRVREGRADLAVELWTENVTASERIAAADPGSRTAKRGLVLAWSRLAKGQGAAGDSARSAESAERSMALARELIPQAPNLTYALNDLGTGLVHWAHALAELGRAAEAAPRVRRFLEEVQQAAREHPQDSELRRLAALALLDFMETLQSAGDDAGARRAITESIAILRELSTSADAERLRIPFLLEQAEKARAEIDP